MCRYRVGIKASVLIALLSVMSCAEDHAPEEPLSQPGTEADFSDEESEAAYDMAEGESMAVSADAAAPAEQPAAKESTPSESRLRHYQGELVLQSRQPTETLAAAEKIVLAAGGRVTTVRSDQGHFKVPVAEFRVTFDKLAALARIESQVVKMDDITDEFQDTGLRIQLLEKMIAKLEDMLAKATKTAEKLALLSEISGLNERLTVIKERRAALKDKAAFSDIAMTVNALPSTLSTTAPQIELFRWLSQTSPNRLPYHSDQEEFTLAETLPGFAVLSDQPDVWIAETPTASRVRAVALPNRPRGDTEFWVKALRNAIGDRYTSTDIAATGSFKTLNVKGVGDYHYSVSVQAVGDQLFLVDAYYPTPDDKQRFEEVVQARLAAWQL